VSDQRGGRWAVRAIALAVGAACMLIALKATAHRAHQAVYPGTVRLAAATALLVVAAVLVGWAWPLVLAARGQAARRLAAGFYLSLLGKYLPGGMWQPVGQVGTARRQGLGLAEATTATVVFALVQLVGGLAIGTALAVAGAGVPVAFRWLAAPGVLALALLDRRWMVWALGRVPRRVRPAAATTAAAVPAQLPLLRSWAATTAGAVVGGLAFAVVLQGVATVALLPAMLAWPVAWAVGFMAVFVPAGLGVREAVLVGLLSGIAPIPAILAASIFLRLATIAAEAVVIVVSRLTTARAGG